MGEEKTFVETIKEHIAYSVLVKEIQAGWTACRLGILDELLQALAERWEAAPETADWIQRLGYFTVSRNLKELPDSISMKQLLAALEADITGRINLDAPEPCHNLLANRPWTTLELLQCNTSYFRICQDIEEHRLKRSVAFLDAVLALVAERIDASDDIEIDGLLFPKDEQAFHLLQVDYSRMVYALRHAKPEMLESPEGQEKILALL